ncbi:MAG: hypothetical protein ACOH5I_04995 [Oligoflexus sp.]
MAKKLIYISILLNYLLLATGCTTYFRTQTTETVRLPFIKNTSNECYYLDEFMPIPDGMVSGESGQLKLRYYTYRAANYKDWTNKQVILSFYSRDERCWSLFEEYYVVD